MAWLLIDNSNTRTKFALGDATSLRDWRGTILTADLEPETLDALLADVKFDRIVCASVVPLKAQLLADYFAHSANFHQLTHQSPLDLDFDLPQPEQIGNDRLANAFALKQKYGFPAVAIDFGTAVTFSVLSAEGKFSGGAIAPGMEAMTAYLSSRTAQLPTIKPTTPKSAIGKTTVEALQSGAVIGHRGMVREILAEIVRENASTPIVIATGGGAEFTASQIAEIHTIDLDLTLEGLRLLAARLE